MAYVIAICGAGGKTTLCKKLAEDYRQKGKRVAILTTTHMWHENEINSINSLSEIDHSKIYYFGEVVGDKIASVSDADYKLICDKFDYVVVEADGSKMMPLKIPRIGEPVIPDNVDEIIITMGLSSVGREIGAVCHRYAEGVVSHVSPNKQYDPSTIVSEDIIDSIIDTYYVKPLSAKFKNAKIVIKKIDFAKSDNYSRIKKLALVLCASGFSKRFGDENKLFALISTKPLYKVMINKLLSTKDLLIDKFSKELSYDDVTIDIGVVTQFDEIIKDFEYVDRIIMIKNHEAEKGLSSSIKVGINRFKDHDAIMFINSDIPKLPVRELTLYLYNSILSNNDISCMYTDGPKNPAYFEKKYFDEILKIEGDKGPRELLVKYKKITYKYHIDEKYLYDIDSKGDLENLWN